MSFRLSEVVCPEKHEITERMTPELEMSGQVVFLSDNGEKKDHFAIIAVDGVVSPLIVPVSRLRLHVGGSREVGVAYQARR